MKFFRLSPRFLGKIHLGERNIRPSVQFTLRSLSCCIDHSLDRNSPKIAKPRALQVRLKSDEIEPSGPANKDHAGWRRRPVTDRSFFRNKNMEWYDLPEADQLNWHILGWTQESWDSVTEIPSSMQSSWQEISAAEQEAARNLGYDEELWDEDEGEVWKGQELAQWEELQEVYRFAWEDLGWTAGAWNARQASEPYTAPQAVGKLWSSLSLQEQEAAARLGFYGKSWNDHINDKGERMKTLAFSGMLLASVIFASCAYSSLTGSSAKSSCDSQEDQVKAVHMRRLSVEARPQWQRRCEEIGFLFHSAHGIKWGSDWAGSWALQDTYWCESGVYLFSADAKEELERASWEVHNMCLEAVDHVVKDEELLELFQIPHRLRRAVRESWENRQPDLLGRFDLLFDGTGPAKLLEYNADTPTLLLESSLAQAQWLSDRRSSFPQEEQFNIIDEELVALWPKFLQRAVRACGLHGKNPTVYFAAQRASMEERCNIDYLASTARRAGVTSELGEMEDFIFAEDGLLHYGDRGPVVNALWKLYPYEWLAEEDLGAAVEMGNECVWSEPPWKSILSNKSILALLWKMFPDHPNLLPAFFTIQEAEEYQKSQGVAAGEWGWVAKPRYGREGIGIRYSFDSPSLRSFEQQVVNDLQQLESFGQTGSYRPELIKQVEQLGRKVLGEFSDNSQHRLLPERHEEALRSGAELRAELPFPPLGGPVFQLYQDTATFAGRRPVIGSWMVFGRPAGICVREDIQRTTDNDSCFTPHVIDKSSPASFTVSGSKDLAGCYLLNGHLGGSGIYFCKQNGLYLLKNKEQRWMFTPHEAGGHDGLQGIAVAEDGSQNCPVTSPNAIPGDAWLVASPSGDLIKLPQLTLKSSAQQLPAQDRFLSQKQAELRKELYGSAGTELKASTTRSGVAGSQGYPAYVNRTTGGFRGHSYSQPSPNYTTNYTGSSHSKQGEDERKKHGRKSAATRAWRKYGQGTTAKTGSYGMRSSSMGSSGSGGS